MDREQVLRDVTTQKIRALARWDPDAAGACDWVRKNPGRFEMEVFLPPCVSVSVPNGAFIGPVENCFNANQLKVRSLTETILRAGNLRMSAPVDLRYAVRG
jgi:structural maintenance of chromosomes protein 5